jgi:purine-nucleoside phosphorylase
MNSYILELGAEKVLGLLPEFKPRLALILGSGWSSAADSLEIRTRIPFADIPGLGATGVQGHTGVLLAAVFDDMQLLVFQGRRHWYEGVGWEAVALPVYLGIRFGISALVLTNAAGGIRPDLETGALMVIDDHINMLGANPLAGPHWPVWGPRFPDQTEVYDRRLRALLDRAGREMGETLPHGVYAASSGPTYETPAEVAACRALGADAVGMSTVPEAILGHAAGLRVAAVSCITNKAAGLGARALRHADVIEQADRNRTRMAGLLTAFLREFSTPPAAE